MTTCSSILACLAGCSAWGHKQLDTTECLSTQTKNFGISLAVQWLRLCIPMQGVQVQSLGRELRFHMPNAMVSQLIN